MRFLQPLFTYKLVATASAIAVTATTASVTASVGAAVVENEEKNNKDENPSTAI